MVATDILLQICIITAISGVGGTGLGGVVSSTFKKDSTKIVSLLLSFAAGVMLSVVCFDLIAGAIHPENGSVGIWLVICSILIGYGVVCVLNFWIDKCTNHEIKHVDKKHPRTHDDLDELIHYDHVEAHKKSNSHLFIAGVVMACAIALHNLPEGMVIGASYAGDTANNISVFSGSGLIMAVVIGLHNIPEGMAVSVPLIAGGMAKSNAVAVTALSGAPTIIGAIIGYYLGTLGPVMLSFSLGFASGAMLYVVFGELLPESILMWKSKLPALAILIGMIVGLFIIYS